MFKVFQVSNQNFEKKLIQIPAVFSLPLSSLHFPTLLRPAEKHRHVAGHPRAGEPRQGATPNGPRPATGPTAGDLPHLVSRPCLARTCHTAGEARRPALAGPLPRPCLGRTSLGLAVPSPSSPSQCAYKRAAPSPCSRSSEHHHHRAISAAARPCCRAPPSAPLPPESSP
jgi:hypothetical protein